jgi:hypothetical protein
MHIPRAAAADLGTGPDTINCLAWRRCHSMKIELPLDKSRRSLRATSPNFESKEYLILRQAQH